MNQQFSMKHFPLCQALWELTDCVCSWYPAKIWPWSKIQAHSCKTLSWSFVCAITCRLKSRGEVAYGNPYRVAVKSHVAPATITAKNPNISSSAGTMTSVRQRDTLSLIIRYCSYSLDQVLTSLFLAQHNSHWGIRYWVFITWSTRESSALCNAALYSACHWRTQKHSP